MREEERKDLVGVLQDQREKNKIDLGEIIGLSEEDAEPLRKMVNRYKTPPDSGGDKNQENCWRRAYCRKMEHQESCCS